MTRIQSVRTVDVRFPTHETLAGSDAMNPDPDYSAAYLRLDTEIGSGHGFTFTIGRGNDIQVAAIESVVRMIADADVDSLLSDMGDTWRRLVHDSPLRWLGPEKGVVHMAIGAVVNALWDLRAKRAGQPLWLHLAGLSPDELISLVDFRYLTDALTPDEALDILKTAEPTRADRIAALQAEGYPGYTTGPGWLGYSDELLDTLCRQAVADGFEQVKLKVGADLGEDKRRLQIARRAVGDDIRIAVDANQRWDVGAAIDWMRELAPYDLTWIEEPTSPDDILGHAAIARAVAPIKVATGEHAANRVIFKQLLQADAVGVVQIDATRVAGVNENIAILLLAAKFGVPVVPHGGGVGLCQAVRHLAFFDYAAVSQQLDGRMVEYVDHLHEHFVEPLEFARGRYLAPRTPGASTEMRPESLERYRYRG
ncbi:enolase C-terminal domain-like protein [Microlunatus sp. Gsoil 973]|uniref:enolase C-terminal domain-like protein n=1 Tax=Microlunatus sp. Gsoil 973 TaxID=2672569 RepID=UPI0012B4FFA8|nr:enolase C-terminal domain-like protein [Microlunatus sp. Gsoil 973]QGN32285.1 fuconate dehydratase [Microlunatus sp. Gsoil 973]